MKCIEYFPCPASPNGHTTRLPDHEAAEEVKEGLARYCPKHVWRSERVKDSDGRWRAP